MADEPAEVHHAPEKKDDAIERNEAFLLDDKMMKLVPQELGASMAAMSIIDSEEATLWPNFIFSMGWFSNVQND